MEQQEVDDLLARVIAQARALCIPVSLHIDPAVRLNQRATGRFGCCRFSGGRYVIEVSARLLAAGAEAVGETLAHEVLHTCPGCRDHGAIWKSYAGRMNGAYGYHISRTGSWEALGLPEGWHVPLISPLGYPAESPAPRPRKAFDEVAEIR